MSQHAGFARLAAWALALLPASLGVAAAASGTYRPADSGYYSLGDFQTVAKIDAHVHLHGAADRFMAQAMHDNFRVLTINVDYPDFPPIAAQERMAVSLRQRYPGQVAFAGTFSVQSFAAPGWLASALHQIDVARQEGAVGVKLWKNIGMDLKDASGHYVMPDDDRLAPLVAKLESEHIVLLGHQAEPLNCWLPFDKMTVSADRDYFQQHPQYYMYRHPEMPSHAALLAARDRMLQAHPALQFDAVHLASLEWDVDEVARFLDRFPQARVDLAARLVHLEYQAARNPDKVRRMLIRYQDRILYGSDDNYGPDESDPGATAAVHSGWLEDWRFLATADPMHSPDFTGPFHGLHLPKPVIDKLYRGNARQLFAGAWN